MAFVTDGRRKKGTERGGDVKHYARGRGGGRRGGNWARRFLKEREKGEVERKEKRGASP